jgi:nucleoside-diphosphate-sugar epimerase
MDNEQIIACVTGSSGFLGQHLAESIAADKRYRKIKLLVHKRRRSSLHGFSNVVEIRGNLIDPGTLDEFIEPGCTVINLAYLHGFSKEENLLALKNLVNTVCQTGIRRFIHCSTAVVAGNIPDNVITEKTPCQPQSEYEKTKFDIEALIKDLCKDSFDAGILRPTAIFGPNGRNLVKLAEDLMSGNSIKSYIKSSLFNNRKMNLVAVDNVVSAIRFLIETKKELNQECYIISDDDDPGNNYRYVEGYLMRHFGIKDYPIPRFPFPLFMLSILLKLTGKTNTNPKRIYLAQKLVNEGFEKKTSFESGLKSFAEWYQKEYSSPTKIHQ